MRSFIVSLLSTSSHLTAARISHKQNSSRGIHCLVLLASRARTLA